MARLAVARLDGLSDDEFWNGELHSGGFPGESVRRRLHGVVQTDFSATNAMSLVRWTGQPNPLISTPCADCWGRCVLGMNGPAVVRLGSRGG